MNDTRHDVPTAAVAKGIRTIVRQAIHARRLATDAQRMAKGLAHQYPYSWQPGLSADYLRGAAARLLTAYDTGMRNARTMAVACGLLTSGIPCAIRSPRDRQRIANQANLNSRWTLASTPDDPSVN